MATPTGDRRDPRHAREREFSRRALLRAGAVLPFAAALPLLAACDDEGGQGGGHGDSRHADNAHVDAPHTDRHADHTDGAHADLHVDHTDVPPRIEIPHLDAPTTST